MKILSIETSCDDTGIAILRVSETRKFEILANEIASQIELGNKYGGVYPIMAKREHEKNLAPTLEIALNASSQYLSFNSFEFLRANSIISFVISFLFRECFLIQCFE